MALPNWTDQQITRQLDSGQSWSGSIFTYAFPTTVSGIDTTGGEGGGFVPLDNTQKEAATLALATWDDLISRSISRVISGLSDIEFGLTNTGIEYAHAYYPDVGSVWFNRDSPELVAPTVGDYGFSTYIHETGHALGLEHAGNYNGSGDWTPLYFEDSTVYSIMSYFGPDHSEGEGQVGWGNWTDASGTTYSPQTPMLNDVMAIQAIYGADTTTRSDDTIYGFGSNITQDGLDAIYDFAMNNNPILCIYDAGGEDTLNLSGWHTQSVIDLSPGAISSCNGMTNNLSIARNTVIENLTTGSGNDTLQGNGANNGLDGGIGFDTAIYQHRIQNYIFGYANGNLIIEDNDTSGDGTDTLTNIEQLKFDDWVGTIKQTSASINSVKLTVSGAFAGYAVTGNDDAAVLVDYQANRDNLQLLFGYERLQFSDYRVGLDSDVGENAGMAYRLYKASFDRIPDLGGVGYWINRIDGGMALESAALEFINSDEFTQLYGVKPTNSQFVTLLYEHVMHRAAEGEGFNFWVNALSPQGGWSRASVLAYFSESEENLGQTADLIANGIQFIEYTA